MRRWLVIVGTVFLVSTVLSRPLVGQTERGPASAAAADRRYARIAILRPHDGETVGFEAGYIRHLEFHRRAKDTWVCTAGPSGRRD